MVIFFYHYNPGYTVVLSFLLNFQVMPTSHNLWPKQKNINQLTHFVVVITSQTYELSCYVDLPNSR